jgi:putative spermidine/putrescine transport system permease protein
MTSFTTSNYASFPPHGFTLHWYVEALSKHEFFESFVLSLEIGFATAILATALGTPVAVAMSRYHFPGRQIINAFFMSPLILPTVVIGIALLQFYNRVGIAGTPLSIIAGHVIITTPYTIRLVVANLARLNPNYELAAQSLGAAPIRSFMRVTVPLILPGLAASAIFAFITSFDDVSIAVFLATPNMVTLPVRIYGYWDQAIYPWLIAICSLIIVWTALVMVIAERVVNVRRLFGIAR